MPVGVLTDPDGDARIANGVASGRDFNHIVHFLPGGVGLGWDGDGMGWGGGGMGWGGVGLGWGWDGMGWSGVGLGWGWVGMGWGGMGWGRGGDGVHFLPDGCKEPFAAENGQAELESVFSVFLPPCAHGFFWGVCFACASAATCAGVRVCGCAGVCGCVGVRVCGCAGVRAPLEGKRERERERERERGRCVWVCGCACTFRTIVIT
jgi:hypothetical protein